MKLTTITNVSVDGVMQGLGGPDEDRRDGFERGGWQRPPGRVDAELRAFIGPATGPDVALELVDSRSSGTGISIHVYRPTGRPQYATATADLKAVT